MLAHVIYYSNNETQLTWPYKKKGKTSHTTVNLHFELSVKRNIGSKVSPCIHCMYCSGTCQVEATSSSEKIKPAIIELRLSEGISNQLVRQ